MFRYALSTMAISAAVVTAPAFAAVPVSEAVTEFQARIDGSRSLTFRSNEGVAYRTDGDTEITFFADHTAHIFLWGYSLRSLTGIYDVQPNGRIHLQFRGMREGWSDVYVDRDARSLFLRQQDPSTERYRVLSGDDEKAVLEMIREVEHRRGG